MGGRKRSILWRKGQGKQGSPSETDYYACATLATLPQRLTQALNQKKGLACLFFFFFNRSCLHWWFAVNQGLAVIHPGANKAAALANCVGFLFSSTLSPRST